jgi:uncharacterized membrane protein
MTLLIAGLVVFFATHLLPTLPGTRAALVARLGERRYKGAFSAASALGLVLIVAGYAAAQDRTPLFNPVAGARAVAPYAIALSFVLLAAANMRGRLRRRLKHPMLLGVLIWSTVHLLANGDRAGTVLFGAFLVYAAVDLVSAVRRGAVRTFEPVGRHDAMAIGGGIVAALVVMTFHRALFGVPVVPFGV